MNTLKYCPDCGKPNLQWSEDKKWICTSCDFVLYHNVAAAVAVIISCENELLFTIRNQNPALGKLDLPGGFVDPKESAEQTCQRELLEEMSITIDINKLQFLGSLPNTYLYKDILYNTLDLFYLYEVESKFEYQLEKSEISEIVWINKDKIPLEEIAFDSQKEFFKNIFYTKMITD